MTIAERQAREAYNRENPWRPMKDAKADGTICELLFNDMAGDFDTEGLHYFLDADGRWYRIEPLSRVWLKPINWRPAYVRLTPERRNLLKRRIEEQDREW